MRAYAWLITKDHLFTPDGVLDRDEAGTSGPRNAPDDLLADLDAGNGREFQMFDDDGELYYTGRILVRGQDETAWTGAGEEDFGPLWDFGRPNAGATEIKYRNADGAWQPL